MHIFMSKYNTLSVSVNVFLTHITIKLSQILFKSCKIYVYSKHNIFHLVKPADNEKQLMYALHSRVNNSIVINFTFKNF